VLPRTAMARSAPWLVADIGGTNARFALAESPRHGARHIRVLPTADFAGPGVAAHGYLEALAAELGEAYQAPRWAAFAVATAVTGDRIEFTNSAWSFSREQVQRMLALDALLVINDFEALALALPHLRAAQLRAHAALPTLQGTLAVVGPGTGLGVGAVTPAPVGWQPIAGEGGHATLAANDDFEMAVIGHARRDFDHVSAERLLSGIGLPTLYRSVAAVLGRTPANLSTAEIVRQGSTAGDSTCVRTVDTFCAMLGSFAGNVALTLGARGGLFVGGGIVPRMADFFFASRFRERFDAKGRFRAYLEGIPTALIVEPYAALIGASAAIEARLARPVSWPRRPRPPG
jgi:glucokinase